MPLVLGWIFVNFVYVNCIDKVLYHSLQSYILI